MYGFFAHTSVISMFTRAFCVEPGYNDSMPTTDEFFLAQLQKKALRDRPYPRSLSRARWQAHTSVTSSRYSVGHLTSVIVHNHIAHGLDLSNNVPMTHSKAYNEGYGLGTAVGSWVLDGNSTADTAQRILKGIEDGDPEVMDLQPAPLSGENGGESISELSDTYGIDLTDDDTATEFELGYSEGYWGEVERMARNIYAVDVEGHTNGCIHSHCSHESHA